MRVLIVKLGAIGDVVMASTALIPLRRKYPGAHITWMVGSALAPLLERIEEIDEVLPVSEKRLWQGTRSAQVRELLGVSRRLAGRRFELVLTGHRDWRYRLLTATTRATERRSLGWGKTRARYLPGRHHCDEYVRLATGIDGPEADAAEFPRVEVTLPERLHDSLGNATAPLVALTPGGARNALRTDDLKRWPVESYVELARKMIERGMRCVLTGDSHDSWTLPHFDGLPTIDLIGKTSIEELVGMYRTVQAVVTHDTGSLHLARLAGARLVTLFGPTMPQQFGPAGRQLQGSGEQSPESIALWGGEHLPCRPCYDGSGFAACSSNLCMQDIQPGEVMASLEQLLEATE